MQRSREINQSKTSLKSTKLSEGAIRGTAAEQEAAEAPAVSGSLPVDVHGAQFSSMRDLKERL